MEINFEDYTAIDIYNFCLGYVTKQHSNDIAYRKGLQLLKDRKQTDLIYSIALNA